MFLESYLSKSHSAEVLNLSALKNNLLPESSNSNLKQNFKWKYRYLPHTHNWMWNCFQCTFYTGKKKSQ